MEANRKKALGSGLEQLFKNNETYDFNAIEENIVKSAEREEITELPLKDLRPNPYQPRKNFDEEALEELSLSIKERGVFQPIIVKKSIKGYEIVAGERRVKASIKAGKTKIPAIVRPFTDEQMMEIALLENLQREDLNPIEEAESFASLINTLNLTQDELAKKLGKSRSYITNMLGLLNLPATTKQEVIGKNITMGHARVLSKLENPEQIKELTNKIIKEGLTVRHLENLASNNEFRRKNVVKRERRSNPEYQFVENLLIEKLDSKVSIKSGKITISFVNEKDLKRILEILDIKE